MDLGFRCVAKQLPSRPLCGRHVWETLFSPLSVVVCEAWAVTVVRDEAGGMPLYEGMDWSASHHLEGT